MAMIDLYAKNPYQHDIEENVMGTDYNGGRKFICGTIVDREHRGDDNAYIIESEYGKDYSGTLYESSIEPFDKKVVLEEIRKDNRLTIRVVSDFNPVIVYVEKDKKEIFSQEISGDVEDPGELIELYEKLLVFLGFLPDRGRMYLGDGLLVLQFEDSRSCKFDTCNSEHIYGLKNKET
jgi:hypothetical protein